MAIDLSKPHRLVDGFLIHVESRKVFRMTGECIGVLPEGSTPYSSAEVLAALKSKPEELKKEEKEEKLDDTFVGVSVSKFRRKKKE